MARMPWLRCVAGTSLVLSMGCQTPYGANESKIMTPPAQFPNPTGPMNPSASKSPTSIAPPPNMPAISDSRLRIGSPAAQAGAPANSGVAKLRPVESTQSTLPPLPNSYPASADVSPSVATSALPQLISSNTLNNGAAPIIAPGAPAMPSLNMPSAQAPNFPAQTSFPSATFQPPPNPAANFPMPNTPSAPNLNVPGTSRSTIYPAGTANQ